MTKKEKCNCEEELVELKNALKAAKNDLKNALEAAKNEANNKNIQFLGASPLTKNFPFSMSSNPFLISSSIVIPVPTGIF